MLLVTLRHVHWLLQVCTVSIYMQEAQHLIYLQLPMHMSTADANMTPKLDWVQRYAHNAQIYFWWCYCG